MSNEKSFNEINERYDIQNQKECPPWQKVFKVCRRKMNLHIMPGFKTIFIFIVIFLITNISTGLPLRAQVPVQEFQIDKSCTNSEIEPKLQNNLSRASNDHLIYSNSSLGFEMEYPADWKRSEEHCILKAQGMIQSASVINFMSTMQSKEPGLIGVSVGDFIFDESIDKFIDVYSQEFGSIIESNEQITFAGQPAAMFVINGGNNTNLLQVTILSDQRKYDITTPITSWSSNATIQAMLNSFKLIGHPTSDERGQNSSLTVDELG